MPSPAKSFQSMWVAGTLGAFFTAVVRNAPIHVQQISRSPDWFYTTDLALRYAYLLWLLAYFFISNLRNEGNTPTGWDIAYDVLQSILSLVAVFSFGFIVTGEGFAAGAYRGITGAADIAIFVICALAYWWFHTEKDDKGLVNGLRIAGALLSLASLTLVIFMHPSWLLLGLIALCLFGLWIVLAAFMVKRLALLA